MANKPSTMIHEDFHYGDVEHAHYIEEGYHICDKFLTDEALAYSREHIDPMTALVCDELPTHMIVSAHQLGAQWMIDLATEPKLLDLLEKQVGPNVVFWSSHLFCKQPHTGEAIPWHQDAPYWNVSKNLSGGVWIAFDDIDEDNGAMSIIPGWHNKGTLKRLYGGEKFFSEEIDPAVLPEKIDEVKVQYKVSAGQMCVHDTMTPHNSVPNNSNRWRRVLVLRYMGAEDEMVEKTYQDYRDNSDFPRIYYLVRGNDIMNRGLNTDLLPASV